METPVRHDLDSAQKASGTKLGKAVTNAKQQNGVGSCAHLGAWELLWQDSILHYLCNNTRADSKNEPSHKDKIFLL